MEKQKKEFPFQIHIVIGIIWIFIGAAVKSGPWSIFWILVGLVFITIGMLAGIKKSKRPISNS
ncbi:hypothetical protein KJA16_03065 [Patescibacteria group bacterium]|nr:hypothetical protein [Patescibacteria group bacterium]